MSKRTARGTVPVLRDDYSATIRPPRLGNLATLVGLTIAMRVAPGESRVTVDPHDFVGEWDLTVERIDAAVATLRASGYLTEVEPHRWELCRPLRDDEVPVYVIGEPGAGVVKIGVSMTPRKRLAQVQTGNPRRLALLTTFPGGYPLESWLHDVFRDYRMSGEWFDFGNRDPLETIQAALASSPAA